MCQGNRALIFEWSPCNTFYCAWPQHKKKKIAQFTNRPLDHFVSPRELNNFFKANIICLVETKYRKHLCRTIIANHILSFTGLGSKGTPYSGGSRGGGLSFFFDQRGPKGRKEFFWRPPSPAYLKVWICPCHVPRCQSPSLQNSIIDADHDCRSPIKYFVEHTIPRCQKGIKSDISLKQT